MICTIVCTGNSLRGFDFSQLKGYVIAVNYAYQYMDYDIVVARDNLEKLAGDKIPRLETLDHHGGRWIATSKKGIAKGENEINCYNSTLLMAINIAIQLGYKDIYVLGADNKIDEYHHFYDPTPSGWIDLNRKEGAFNSVAIFLNELKEYLTDERLIFIESSLIMFENLTLEEYVNIDFS